MNDISVCATFSSCNDGCGWETQINIKRCQDGSYRYQLVAPQTCPIAYCAGDFAVCPNGQIWDPNAQACIGRSLFLSYMACDQNEALASVQEKRNWSQFWSQYIFVFVFAFQITRQPWMADHSFWDLNRVQTSRTYGSPAAFQLCPVHQVQCKTHIFVCPVASICCPVCLFFSLCRTFLFVL